MRRLWRDTTPEAERVLLDLIRQATPARKLEIVGNMNKLLRELAISGLRSRHPDASDEEIHRRLADIVLGPDLAERVFGPLADYTS